MRKKQTNALIYCRVSDTKQKEEGSEIKAVFSDDVSGGGNYAKRPGMTALLSYLEKNRETPSVVMFDDVSHLRKN